MTGEQNTPSHLLYAADGAVLLPDQLVQPPVLISSHGLRHFGHLHLAVPGPQFSHQFMGQAAELDHLSLERAQQLHLRQKAGGLRDIC